MISVNNCGALADLSIRWCLCCCHGRADISLQTHTQHDCLLERGLLGGLVAGILWQLNHVLSAMYVSHVLMKNDLYTKTYGGSLGLLPVFMLAVYFTWLIILYGALVAARVQYHSSPLTESVEDKDAEPEKPVDAKKI